jgi:DNA-binding CsgD family transcriptional regulator
MKTSALREPPVYVVLVDARGIILDVSTKAGRAEGSSKAILSLYPVGRSYFEHCEDENQVADVQLLLKRKRSLISFVLPSRAPRQKQWFVVIGVPVSAEIGSGAVLMHVDIAAWIAEEKDPDEPAKGVKPPVSLNPSLIQDTIAKALFQQFGPGFGEAPTQPPIPSDVDTLSPRQREVLMLLGAGKSNAEIAEELSCSLNTVKRHVTAVLQKLRLPNRTRAAMLANRLNYVQGED